MHLVRLLLSVVRLSTLSTGPLALDNREIRGNDQDMTTTQASDVRHQHQVLGLDGSAGSNSALQWALRHVGVFGDVKPVMTWLLPWWASGAGTPGAYAPPPTIELQLQAENQIAAQLESVDSTHLLPSVVIHGRPGPTLVEVAHDASLLVVGTRGRGALADTILGSVSTHVASHAPCPVAIVPEHAPTGRDFDRIIVGTDGSETSLRALEWAVNHSSDDTTIEVYHTWSALPAGGIEASITIVDDLRLQADRLADETVAKVIADLGVDANRFEIHVEMGDARNVLREASRDADLLVVGSRGHRGVAHLLLGSVATGLVHQPLVPTVVVPNDPED